MSKFVQEHKYTIAAASGALFGGALYGLSYYLIPATIGALNFFIASSLSALIGSTAAVVLSYALPALLAVLAAALIAMAIAYLFKDIKAPGDNNTGNNNTDNSNSNSNNNAPLLTSTQTPLLTSTQNKNPIHGGSSGLSLK